jgi:hypothetical protein
VALFQIPASAVLLVRFVDVIVDGSHLTAGYIALFGTRDSK